LIPRKKYFISTHQADSGSIRFFYRSMDADFW